MSCRGFTPWLAIASNLAVLCALQPARASDLSTAEFDIPPLEGQPSIRPSQPASLPDDSASPAEPVRASQRGPLFALAERAEESGEPAKAAAAWYLILQQASPNEQERRIAEYQLAAVLAKLGLVYVSVDWFRLVTERRDHPMRLEALVQLGRISQNLSELDPLLPLAARYGLTDLERLELPTRSERVTLCYLTGRGLYTQGDYAAAQRAFARIDSSHTRFLEARLFESACHVRQRHAVPALTSLKRGIEALERGKVRTRERQRWLDLYHLSAARIYYSSAIALDRETNIPRVDQTRLSAAVKHYNLLEPESEYFEVATFELAWVYFMAGQYSFALGKIFSLESPYYPLSFSAEASILKAVIYEANCNYDAATITRARFNARYVPLREALKQLLRQPKSAEPDRLVRVFEALRHNIDAMGSPLEPTVGAAYRERAFLRRLSSMEAIEAEIVRFEGLSRELRHSSLGTKLRTQYQQLRSEAASRADNWIRQFLLRRVDEIDEHLRNGDKILLNHSIMQRSLLDTKLKSGQVSKRESSDWGRVHGDEEHVIWPFNGEYWRDELGTYRQNILSTCGR